MLPDVRLYDVPLSDRVSMAQWVYSLTRNRCIAASREFEPSPRLTLYRLVSGTNSSEISKNLRLTLLSNKHSVNKDKYNNNQY